MSRYEVVFSARALESLRQVTRYIAEESGIGRATDWLARVRDSTVTLETHPYAFPLVGEFEGVRIRARPIMRHVLYYFVDESANAVTVVDVVHSARAHERERYEGG
ncbi:MAG: type II toxin-antitoxin system RelE/ParE family toxin [Gemmatimonadetes bacterium]|nr:type II toxin-antitoxin system RelE/ParE family toxin [Gemmatimonadota bacterium]